MRLTLNVCGVLAVMLLMPLAAVAQDVTAPALKAAFIYNFAKFTEWPVALPASEPFVICVLGDAAVGDALERVVKGREFAGRRMVGRSSPPPRPTGRLPRPLRVGRDGGRGGAGDRRTAGLAGADDQRHRGIHRRRRHGAVLLRARPAAFQHQARGGEALRAADQLEAAHSGATHD